MNRPEVSLLDETPRRQERSAVLGKIAEYMTVSTFVLTIIAYEWAHWYFHWTPRPFLFAALGGSLIIYALLRICLLLPKLSKLKQEAQAAEQYGLALQQLAAKGWYVFKDVRDQKGYNIGNVVAGQGGLFALTARHLTRSDADFECIELGANGTLLINGAEPLGEPIVQARCAATALYSILAEAGLDTVEVMPVVIFPLWRIKHGEPQEEQEDPEVWVLNEAELMDKLMNLPPALEPKSVIQLCTVLEKYSHG